MRNNSFLLKRSSPAYFDVKMFELTVLVKLPVPFDLVAGQSITVLADAENRLLSDANTTDVVYAKFLVANTFYYEAFVELDSIDTSSTVKIR